jgi:hypothetical protein
MSPREEFDCTEASIADLTADAQPKGIKEALYGYLLAVTNGKQPNDAQSHAVLQYIALGLEGVPPSIAMEKGKRRMHCAGIALFLAHQVHRQPIGKAVDTVAQQFDMSLDALDKQAGRSGLKKLKFGLKLKHTYRPPEDTEDS